MNYYVVFSHIETYPSPPRPSVCINAAIWHILSVSYSLHHYVLHVDL